MAEAPTDSAAVDPNALAADLANVNISGPNAQLQIAGKIVEEFQYLLEKSQQLFAGLRDLPPTGGHKQWQPYFQRTFEVYTKLWKFQQQHRGILENKENYGLKRWEIGEIASKIGQLYYHYYLRTSETNYLHESFVFYEAIRQRAYFKDVLDAKNPPLMIKKLRYYARFIVVCLLLNRKDLVKVLMDELTALVDDYTRTFKPTDAAEWQLVLQEINTFLEADKKLNPLDLEGSLLPVIRRLQIIPFKHDKEATNKIKLQEAILVGNYQNQIKFSELTLDMYRMLQSLEREPSTPGSNTESKDAEGADGQAQNGRRTNPHKYLLYRPTFSQLYVFISTAFKEISENSALLIYVSADGNKRVAGADEGPLPTGFSGGVATSVRRPTERPEGSGAADAAVVAAHTLHPGDLVPFTRKPLFVIVDSNNSAAFQDFARVFNQPLVILLSPTEYPSTIKDPAQVGNLFTLFLHAPLLAFAFISNVTDASAETWTKCGAIVAQAEARIVDLLHSNEAVDKSFKRFLQDDFLRQFLVRFVFCSVVLSLHNAFEDEKFRPSVYPKLPEEVLADAELTEIVLSLAEAVNVRKIIYTKAAAKEESVEAPAA